MIDTRVVLIFVPLQVQERVLAVAVESVTSAQLRLSYQCTLAHQCHCCAICHSLRQVEITVAHCRAVKHHRRSRCRHVLVRQLLPWLYQLHSVHLVRLVLCVLATIDARGSLSRSALPVQRRQVVPLMVHHLSLFYFVTKRIAVTV